MYLDYCERHNINLYRHLNQLLIKLDESGHHHIFFGKKKIGEIWPVEFKEKNDGYQRVLVTDLKYEPFRNYFDDYKMMDKAEKFLAGLRHSINSDF